MSPPRNESGPAPAAASGTPGSNSLLPRAAINLAADRSRNARALVAHALLLLAGPDAVFDRLLVRTCPAGCHYSHLHFVPLGAWRQPLVRAPRCRPWLRYRIEIVDVLPAVPDLAGQRRRGAA